MRAEGDVAGKEKRVDSECNAFREPAYVQCTYADVFDSKQTIRTRIIYCLLD